MNCDACEDHGWLLMDNSDHGLRIERCDECKIFGSDEEAVAHVAVMASRRQKEKNDLYTVMVDRSLFVGLQGLALLEHKTVDELVNYILRRMVQLTK